MSLSDDSSIEEVAVVSFEEGRERRLREAEAHNEVIDLADDKEDQKCLLLVSLPAEVTNRFKEVGFIEWFSDLLPVFEASLTDIKRFCQQSEKVADEKIRYDEDQQPVHIEENGRKNAACNRSSCASPSSPAVAGEGQELSVKDNPTDPKAPTSESTSTTSVANKAITSETSSNAKSSKKSRVKPSTSKKSKTKNTSKSSKPSSRPYKKASKPKAKASASSTPKTLNQFWAQQNTPVTNNRKGKKPISGESSRRAVLLDSAEDSSSLSSSSDDIESSSSSSSSSSSDESLSLHEEAVRRRNAKNNSRRKPSKAAGLSKDASFAPRSSTSKGRQSRKRKSGKKVTGKSQARVVSPGGGVKEQTTTATKRVKQPGQCSLSSKARKNDGKRKKESPAAKGAVPQRHSSRGVAKDSYAEIGSSDIDSDYL